MCPDREIISLYIDNELLSPWKEKMESHLKSCPKCQKEFDRYKLLGETLGSLDDGSLQAAQERVWKNLCNEAVERSVPRLIKSSQERTDDWRFGRKKLWKRTITLPLPVAAAVLLMIAFPLAFNLMRNYANSNDSTALMQEQPTPITQEWSVSDDYGTILPALDMDDFLQLLINQNEGDFVIVRLPENSRFSRVGQPTLINASDYSRRRMHR